MAISEENLPGSVTPSEPKWLFTTKTMTLALANLLVAYMGIIPPKWQFAANVVAVAIIRVWGGDDPNGGSRAATFLPPSMRK